MQDINVKDQILLAALPNVVFDGWTDAVIEAGAVDAGFEPSMAVRAFPNGVTEFVSYFSSYINRQMAAQLETADLSNMGIAQRLEKAMEIRLSIEAPHKEAARKALSFYTVHSALGVEMTWKAVDEMWWCCGDESVDFNFYTKRASLAAVYGATMLYWMSDDSEDSVETLKFYRRRLIDVVKAVKWRKDVTSKIASFFGKGFVRPGGGLMKR